MSRVETPLAKKLNNFVDLSPDEMACLADLQSRRRSVAALTEIVYEGQTGHRAPASIIPHLDTEIVKRSDRAKGFFVVPKRRIVERTIAWLNRCRRLAKDWENLNRNASLSSSSPQSASCSENPVIIHKVSGQALTMPRTENK